jgi:hypothetical protein
MSDTQRWTIDTIEEGTASIELPDGKVITLPAAILPKAARSGQVLRVTIELDPAASKQALAASAAQVAIGRDASRKRDKGGDIVL